jgi:DNA-binding SARP family transcriptional activator
MYELTLLGGTRLTALAPDAPHVIFTSGKPLALLAFLQCAPAQSASREQLIELLWSDADPEAARHTLRQTLWYIRRKLGVDPFETTGDGVRLQTPLASDRDRFLAALGADESEQAVHSYGGDFFPEFAAPGGAGFEHWADLERTRLRALYLGAATRVVRDRLSKGRARDAIVVARTARDMAPFHQVAWRLVLESTLAADDVISAAVEVERLQQWLHTEDIEPDTATTQLLKAARAGRSGNTAGTAGAEHAAPDSTTLTAELVGRELEFSELIAAFEATKRGESRHVHLVGAAGHGKTRLLDGFGARLRASRVRVVAVGATMAERSLPYAFAAQLVSALVSQRGASAVSPDTARTLVALAPASSSYLSAEPDRTTGDDALRRRSLALAELVTTIAHDAPLVLLIDDVHWMDAQSRTMVAALAGRLIQTSVLLVTAARSTDRFVEETPLAKRVLLAPLSVEDVGALVMSIGQLPRTPWADALIPGLHAASGGSPLLVLEALQLVMERSQLVLENGLWTTHDAAALTNTLSAGRAMQQRLSSLPADARDALLRLSIAGTAVDDTMMTHILAQDGRQSLPALETRGLVVHSEGQWRTAHDEIAALAIEMAGTSDCRRAHAAVAEYFERDTVGNTAMLLRAAQHRARAADPVALDRVFTRAVRSAHLHGELTAIRQLAQETLGTQASPDDVELLVQRLPWRVRYRPRRWLNYGAVAVSVAVLVVSIVVQATPKSAGHEVSVSMVLTTDNTPTVVSIGVDVADLRRSSPIDAVAEVLPVPLDTLLTNFVNARMANGDFLGVIAHVNPELGMDVVRIPRSGRAAVFISGPKDQAANIVSPDGKVVAYTSGEWHAQERSEIAIYDERNGTGRQLTNSDARELSLQWSNDGSRIAFMRSYATEQPASVCWVTIDSSREQCVTTAPDLVAQLVLAWTSDYTVLVTLLRKSTGETELAELNFPTGELRTIDRDGTRYVADPTGQVVICHCRVPGLSAEVYTMFAVTDPARKRVVSFNGVPVRAKDARVLYWSLPNTQIETLSIDPDVAATVASVGQSIVYDVIGTNAKGLARTVPNVQWTSADTSVATIDSTGKAHFLKAGRVRFTVSAGGWRTHTFEVPVGATAFTAAFREEWQRDVDSAWIRFGTPLPTIVRHANGAHGLRINGDQHLHSGLVSKRSIDESQGVGVRVQVYLPIDSSQWQNLAVALDAVATDTELSEWTDRSLGIPPAHWSRLSLRHRCGLVTPMAEGGEYIDMIGLIAGDEDVRPPTQLPRITDRKWHTVTIQTFPDGRCAFGLDGKPVAMSTTSMSRGRPLRVTITGQSVGTHIEIGAVEAWQGLRPDIDWNQLPRVAGAPVR